jgi:hypothetical protein
MLVVVALVGTGAILASTIATRTPVAPAASSRIACGIERWGVKTLTDKDAPRIRQRPKLVSISSLRSLPHPDGVTYGRTKDRVELQVLRIHAVLWEARDEDDGDIHLIVGDPAKPSATMVVELPAAGCTRGARSKLRREMSHAREKFVRACGESGNVTGTATITGVGFWDRPHATGAAPNGIELHPVLSIATKCRA